MRYFLLSRRLPYALRSGPVIACLWLAMGSSVAHAQEAIGPSGTVRVDYPLFRLTLLPDGGVTTAPEPLQVDGQDGRATVKAGRYTVSHWEIEARDGGGRTWKLAGEKLPRPIEVRAGEETRLGLAAPLQAHLMVFPEASPVMFRLLYTGPIGEQISYIAVAGVPPTPQMKIVNADSKVVESLPLQPCCGGTATVSWSAPDTLRGRFKAIPEVQTGPFPVEVGAGVAFDLTAGRLRIPEPKVGNVAPDFVLWASDGTKVQLSFLRDRPVVLSFYCRCGLCQALATALTKRADIASRAHVIAIFGDLSLSKTQMEEFRKATGFSGVALWDLKMRAARGFQSQECPRVFVIGCDGHIRYTNRSRTTPAEQLAAEVSAAVGQAEDRGSPLNRRPATARDTPARAAAIPARGSR